MFGPLTKPTLSTVGAIYLIDDPSQRMVEAGKHPLLHQFVPSKEKYVTRKGLESRKWENLTRTALNVLTVLLFLNVPASGAYIGLSCYGLSRYGENENLVPLFLGLCVASGASFIISGILACKIGRLACKHDRFTYGRKAENLSLGSLNNIDPSDKEGIRKLESVLNDKGLGSILHLMDLIQVYQLYTLISKSRFAKILANSNLKYHSCYLNQVMDDLHKDPKDTFLNCLTKNPQDFCARLNLYPGLLRLIFYTNTLETMNENRVDLENVLRAHGKESLISDENSFEKMVTLCNHYSPYKKKNHSVQICNGSFRPFFADFEALTMRCLFFKSYDYFACEEPRDIENQIPDEKVPFLRNSQGSMFSIDPPSYVNLYYEENMPILLKCIHLKDAKFLDGIKKTKQMRSMFHLADYLLCDEIKERIQPKLMGLAQKTSLSLKEIEEWILEFPDWDELHVQLFMNGSFINDKLNTVEELPLLEKILCFGIKKRSGGEIMNKVMEEMNADADIALAVCQNVNDEYPTVKILCMRYLENFPQNSICTKNIKILSHWLTNVISLHGKCQVFLKYLLATIKKRRYFKQLCTEAEEGTPIYSLIQQVSKWDREKNNGKNLMEVWPNNGEIPTWLLA